MATSIPPLAKSPLTKYYEALVHLYPLTIPLPRITSTDYVAAFKTYTKSSEDTKNLMESLMNSRQAMLNLIGSGGAVQDQVQLVDAYLQQVYTLYESLIIALSNKQNIVCSKEIAFEWQMYLMSRPTFKTTSLVYEIAMLTHLKAMLHYQLALQMFATDVTSFASEAGKQLLLSAGYFDLLATNLATGGKWERKFHPKEPNPAELTAKVCQALAVYCRSKAQAAALVKALHENKMTAMLKVRLALGAASLSTQALDHLTASIPAYIKPEAWVYPLLSATIGTDKELARGVAHFYLALHCGDDKLPGGKQVGQALACAAIAKNMVTEQQRQPLYSPALPGLPRYTSAPYNSQLGHIVDLQGFFLQQLGDLEREWDRDNRFIYFQVTPKSSAEFVVPYPADAIVANPAAATEPGFGCVPFVDPPKPAGVLSSLGSVFGFGAKSKDAAPAAGAASGDAAAAGAATAAASAPPAAAGAAATASPASPGAPVGATMDLASAPMLLTAEMLTGSGAAPARDMTDEEFAQELQRRLNA